MAEGSRGGRACIILQNLWVSCLLFLLFVSPSPAQGQLDSTLWTSYVPLAVRSPYFSAWMNTTNVALGNKRAPEIWPLFWTSTNPAGILGWAGHVRVDSNTTYKWLGDAGSPGGLNFSVLNNIEITPTRTIMSITAGPVDLNVTYFSPIEPSDPVKQSLPFSYFTLTAASNDGQSHEVQVYTDISAEWLSGNRKLSGNWNTQPTDTILYHRIFLTNPEPFSEIINQAQDGTVYLATLLDPKMTYRTDTDVNCRGQFSSQGTLANSVSTGPLPINSPFTVYAISKNLGTVTTPTDPVVWAIGMLRDPVVQFTDAQGTTEQRVPYWRSQFSQDQDIITDFLQDYPSAIQRADALDAALEKNASAVSSHYADLVAVTARQTMGATELTVGAGDNGGFNFSDVKMFMKNLGVDGSTSRVNAVEVLYQSFPFFLSLNASYGGWLLSPVLDFASSSAWSLNHQFAPRDIGTAYPNATGNAASHNQGVEQSGNMLIMALAHARASGDGSLLTQYYSLLKTWADYLVNNTSPVPSGQVTADGDSTANSTNLAIKGIIAIGAMSQISAALKQDADAEHYSSLATAYVNTWKSLAMPSGSQQILYTYGASSSSYALQYNLFADKWLGTGLVDDATYSSETSFLQNLLNSNANGLPIDSQPNSDGNTAWTLFTAMTVTDTNVRNAMIDQIWNFASKNASQTIFATEFTLDGKGSAVNNIANPGVGGAFASLALALPNVTIDSQAASASGSGSGSSGSGNGTSGGNSKTNVGPIVGGVVGGVGGFILLLLLGIFFWRRSRRTQNEREMADVYSSRPVTQPVPYNYAREETLPWNAPGSEPGPGPAQLQGSESQAQLMTSTAISGSSGPSKAREARHRPAPSQGTSSAYTTGSGPTSSRVPTTAGSTSELNTVGSPISPSEVVGLRIEVENLRRVMQEFQVDRMEPPPTYHEGE